MHHASALRPTASLAIASLASALAADRAAARPIDAHATMLGAGAIESGPLDAADPGDPAPLPAPVRARFGAKDSLRLDVEGDWAGDLDGTNLGQGRLGVAWFFVDDFEVAIYGSAGYAAEPAGAGAGLYGGDLQFRWHLLAADAWSIFLSGGCGLLGSSSPFPAGGTNFNFTPSAGAGVTFDAWEGTRAYVSVRWYHASNAATSSGNPGFNGLDLWVGLSFGL